MNDIFDLVTFLVKEISWKHLENVWFRWYPRNNEKNLPFLQFQPILAQNLRKPCISLQRCDHVSYYWNSYFFWKITCQSNNLYSVIVGTTCFYWCFQKRIEFGGRWLCCGATGLCLFCWIKNRDPFSLKKMFHSFHVLSDRIPILEMLIRWCLVSAFTRLLIGQIDSFHPAV